MLTFQHKHHKTLGFSLLEIILVCGLLAIIIIGSAQYFNAAQNDYRVTKTIQDIKNIREGAAEWVLGNPDYSALGSNGMGLLNSANLVPTDVGNGNGTNPWNGNYIITATSGSTIAIKVTGVPTAPCTNLALKMIHAGTSAGCDSGTFTINF